MSKQCEIDYFQAIGPAGREHAIRKPFSDDLCSNNLVQFGTIMRLLPRPPARVLDVGCGTGWTSLFLGRRGYEVTGVDISLDMLQAADALRRAEGLDNVRFVASDYEALPFDAEFDAVIFYDSLHHAVDEVQAVRSAHRVLMQGGQCITSEPGVGHASHPHSQAAVACFGVTEKDMPPFRIFTAGRAAGFREFRVYPNPSDITRVVYDSLDASPAWTSRGPLREARRIARFFKLRWRTLRQRDGIACMTK